MNCSERKEIINWHGKKKDWAHCCRFSIAYHRETKYVHPIRGIFNYFMKFSVVSFFLMSITLFLGSVRSVHSVHSVRETQLFSPYASIEFSFLALIIIIISFTLLLLSFILFICVVRSIHAHTHMSIVGFDYCHTNNVKQMNENPQLLNAILFMCSIALSYVLLCVSLAVCKFVLCTIHSLSLALSLASLVARCM